MQTKLFLRFGCYTLTLKNSPLYTSSKSKGKVFYGQEPPSGETTATDVGSVINYLQ